MSEPERNRIVYVTADSSMWVVLDEPFGLISPPTIDLHQPRVGTVTFYYAECYGLRIPQEAQEAQYPMRFINVQPGRETVEGTDK